MSKLVLNGDTSGSVTLDAPAVSGTTTLTLPTTTGTLVVTSGAQTIEFADGSASAPSITNSGDTNTGMFFPAADTIAFAEGGTEAMRLDSSGNVGIGASTANERLVINGSTNINSAIRLQNQGTNIGFVSTYAAWAGTGSDNTFSIASVGALGMMFATNGVERMRIDSSGVISTGTAYASGTIGVVIGKSGAYPVDRGISVANSSGSAIPLICYTNSTTQAGYILTSGSTIAFVQGSDYRLKENIVDMDKSETLSKLMEVRPINFDWKDGNTLHNYGFLAHELQNVFPQAVHGEKDAINEDGSIKTQSVNLTALVPYLVASIQEQQTIINDLKTDIAALKAKVGE